MADFNGNGRLDILNTSQYYNPIYDVEGCWSWINLSNLYFNEGDGNWSRKIIENTPNGLVVNSGIDPLSYSHFATFDYDNDGDVDVLVTGIAGGDDWTHSWERVNCAKVDNNGNYACVALYENDGKGNFTLVDNEKAKLPVIVPFHDRGDRGIGQTSLHSIVAAGDFDRDGLVDLVFTGVKAKGSAKGVFLYRHLPNGSFEEVKLFNGTSKFPGVYGNVRFADINNDGWLDIIVTGQQANSLNNTRCARIFINEEGRSFRDPTPFSARFSTHRNGNFAVSDFNKDGWLDIISAGYNDGGYGDGVQLYLNNCASDPDNDANSIYGAPVTLAQYGVSGGENASIVARDFNGDGNLDFQFDGNNDNRVFYGKADNTFEAVSFEARGGNGHNNQGAYGDATGNGYTDRFQIGSHWCSDQWGSKRFSKGGDWNDDATLYINDSKRAIEELPAPTILRAGYAAGEMFVEWADINDLTAAYNPIFCTPSGKTYSLLPVDTESGKLRVAEGKVTAVRPGVNRYSVNIDEPAYENLNGFRFGVQALSLYNEKNSPIAWAGPGHIDGVDNVTELINPEVKLNVSIDGDFVTVASGSDATVNIHDMLGHKVATGQAGEPMRVAGRGVFMVSVGTVTAKISK